MLEGDSMRLEGGPIGVIKHYAKQSQHAPDGSLRDRKLLGTDEDRLQISEVEVQRRFERGFCSRIPDQRLKQPPNLGSHQFRIVVEDVRKVGEPPVPDRRRRRAESRGAWKLR